MSAAAKRVVVTGFGGITALGQDWPTIERALRANASGVARIAEWDRYTELNTRLGGPVPEFTLPPQYTRKVLRTMGRVAVLATRATEMAMEDAGLIDDPVVGSGHMGVAYGSCTGSTDAVREFGSMLTTGDVAGINATTYLRMMPHTAAANIGLYFGMKGRVIPACSACTSLLGVRYDTSAVPSLASLARPAASSAIFTWCVPAVTAMVSDPTTRPL